MKIEFSDIDECINSAYGSSTGGGELKQLAVLFSPQLWRSIETLLNKKLKKRNNEKFQQEFKVSLGWIDKIPMAEFTPQIRDINQNLITQRTEVGDAAFFFIEKRQFKGETKIISSRGLILQAKEAKTKQKDNPKLRVPIVPWTNRKNDSTVKELALISDWPVFDLYFTAKSKNILQSKYNIKDQNKTIQPHAWYIGASPKTAKPWNPRWIAGPSKKDAICDKSLGELLCAILFANGMINSNGMSIEVGYKFSFDENRIINSKNYTLSESSNPPNWDDLCHQIILSCKKYAWPSKIFNNSNEQRISNATFYVNPLLKLFEFLYEIIALKNKKYPVVIVELVSREM